MYLIEIATTIIINLDIYKKVNNNLNTNNAAFYKINIDINNVQM